MYFVWLIIAAIVGGVYSYECIYNKNLTTRSRFIGAVGALVIITILYVLAMRGI
jgi:hypothetical protein